jgi:hypothetical protein
MRIKTGTCISIALLGAFLLTGCDLDNLNPKQTSTVCKALIGPIKYNTYNKLSQRYAAMLLASDLQQRNLVGQYLKCPQYR